jgi:hypothetical protein
MTQITPWFVESGAATPTSVVGGAPLPPVTEGEPMKYVVLIHSNPRPWGHPTSDFVAEHQALPKEQRDELQADFEELLTKMQADGELLGGEALADPTTARLYRWADGEPVAVDGPYSEAREHLAGFFLIDVDAERIEEIGRRFSGPGETVEIRPAMWPGGGDS